MAGPERVGVRELRQHLSRWLRRVEDGETFEVTERGRPVALLGPLHDVQSGAIARLAAQGRLARLATLDLAELAPPEPIPPGSTTISEALQEIREDTV
jgi:prevent-host-death family protein